MNERPHKKLKLWEKVMSVIEEVYDMTDTISEAGKLRIEHADEKICCINSLEYC
jgi:hypothetical protein